MKKKFAPPTQWCFGLSSFVVLIVNPFVAEYFLEFQKTIFHQIFRKNVTPCSIIQVEGRKSTEEENDINDASLSDKFVVVLKPNQMRQSD